MLISLYKHSVEGIHEKCITEVLSTHNFWKNKLLVLINNQQKLSRAVKFGLRNKRNYSSTQRKIKALAMPGS